jgi:hypothetical protein
MCVVDLFIYFYLSKFVFFFFKNPNILTNVNVDHFVKTAVFVDHGPWTYVLLAGFPSRWMILTVA